MDKIKAFVQENREIIVGVLHLVVIIPVLFLAIRPEYVPSMVPRGVVMYSAYAILLAGVVWAVMMLVKAVQARIKVKAVEEPVVQVSTV